MEFELKKLSKAAIPAALGRAERYRLLNEPALAESICQDILVVEPDNRQAIALLILALSDQFIENIVDNLDHAWSLLSRLNDEYLQAYYQGILFERQARVYMRRAAPGSHFSRTIFSVKQCAYMKRPKGSGRTGMMKPCCGGIHARERSWPAALRNALSTISVRCWSSYATLRFP